MPKFMLVYRGGHAELENASPEQMQQVVQMWMDWIEGGIEAGWMLDGGDGLKPCGAVVNPDPPETDGPLAESTEFTESKGLADSKELVAGYSMVEASDLAAAIELAKGSPMPKSGGTVEVRELAHVGKQDE